jgi:hypothetical protein
VVDGQHERAAVRAEDPSHPVVPAGAHGAVG